MIINYVKEKAFDYQKKLLSAKGESIEGS